MEAEWIMVINMKNQGNSCVVYTVKIFFLLSLKSWHIIMTVICSSDYVEVDIDNTKGVLMCNVQNSANDI